MRFGPIPALTTIGVALIALASCGPEPIGRLERESLFSLGIGKLEDELDLFHLSDRASIVRAHQFMRDGIFYVTNSNTNKVIELTSYGDVLSMVYNRESNPEPVLLNTNPNEGSVTSRIATEYPFQRVGRVVVSSDATLYVEDMVGESRSIYDEDLEVQLRRIVLRFDSRGELVDYIGQEGVGGSPFPYIEDLFITASDELIVVTRTESNWLTYWYSKEGDLLYEVPIELDRLPVPPDTTGIPELEAIVPDLTQPLLYVKVNLYEQRAESERDGWEQDGQIRTSSRVYHLDLMSGRYEDYFSVPTNFRTINAGDAADPVRRRLHYELLGTAPRGHIVFLSRGREEEAELLITTSAGRVIDRRRLLIEHAQLFYQDLNVSPSGILTGMLAWENTVRFVWWRSDRLLAGQEES